jgi:putative chitinase
MITLKQFGQIFPTLPTDKRASYLHVLVAAMIEFQITTRTRAAAFLAQLGHESNDLRSSHEIWQGGPNEGTAAQHRYDVRADLGNTPERDGDGFKFRGHGWLQTTGKTNHRRVSRGLGLGDLFVEHPELLEQPQYAARSAGFFWADNKLNRNADKLTGRGDARDLAQFDTITKKVNGGISSRCRFSRTNSSRTWTTRTRISRRHTSRRCWAHRRRARSWSASGGRRSSRRRRTALRSRRRRKRAQRGSNAQETARQRRAAAVDLDG